MSLEKRKTTYLCYNCLKEIPLWKLKHSFYKAGKQFVESDWIVNLEYSCCSFGFTFMSFYTDEPVLDVKKVFDEWQRLKLARGE